MNELPDRLLRGALRDRAAAASDVCADADALAAWADGTMRRPARAAFEAHAADCARCQALMAAMSRTDPSPVEPAWWRRSPFSWLMPVAAATAVIAIVVDQARTERPVPAAPPLLSAARQESAAAANVPQGPVAAPAPEPASPPRPDARRDALVTSGKSRPQPPAAARSIPDAVADARKNESRAKDATAVVMPTSPAAPLPTPAAAPAPPPPAAAATAVARERAAPRMADAPTPLPVESSRSEGAGSRSLGITAMATPIVIVSPNRDSQWRIVNSAIEHTTDGGRTWQAQPLGAGAAIRAGAAPGAQVCWLVGARGVVMLTTDRVTWRRIAFPDLVDLAAIQASDDAHATVTTATGRSYVTIDGGKTWTRR